MWYLKYNAILFSKVKQNIAISKEMDAGRHNHSLRGDAGLETQALQDWVFYLCILPFDFSEVYVSAGQWRDVNNLVKIHGGGIWGMEARAKYIMK